MGILQQSAAEIAAQVAAITLRFQAGRRKGAISAADVQPIQIAGRLVEQTRYAGLDAMTGR